jgi:hypothetical protein
VEAPRKKRTVRTATLAVILLAALLFVAACGGETGGGGGAEPPEENPDESPAVEETTSAEQALTPAEATVGPDENSSMLPAGGREADPAQPPPENPPEGVVTYPATTNNTVEGRIEYDRNPPTNGDHDPLWQNCGFYSEPIENRHAVHSMDHGVVWISFDPDLPQQDIEALRPYGEEPYVIVSPYPGLRSPVVVTAWRNQLDLDGVDDPRLRQFVDQFRVSETSPLSGNGCTGGVGEPEA